MKAHKFFPLLVSDRCSEGLTQDLSGPCIRLLVTEGRFFDAIVSEEDCVPDDLDKIKGILTKWCDESNLNLIFTLGGTGFSQRDVTPEATKAVIEKEAPGLSQAMIKMSLDITPLAMLSRPVCGIRKQSLIINLPGSPKAVKECFQMIAPSLEHAVDLICGNKNVAETHKKMQIGEVGISSIKQHHVCHHKKKITDNNSEAVAFRPRHSTFPMKTVDEAQKIVLDQCFSLALETVDYMESIGHVLAEDIYSKDPLPPFPASMKDGYAVIASDCPGIRQVIGASTAGSLLEDTKVEPGLCMRISTGAPLPPGADSVVMVEDTKLVAATEDGREELQIEITTEVQHGQEIRPIGSDISEGEKVLEQGTPLSASEIGILATVGQTRIKVHPLPTIAVLSTGNELQESQPTLQMGRIRDSNRPALISFLKHQGYPVFDAGIAEDNPAALHKCITTALDKADVLVSTGGVSMGEMDLLRHILIDRFKATIHFGRVDMKPGKPTTFATCHHGGKSKLVFGLPGNPVSAVVTCHLYVIPACRKLSGQRRFLPVKVKAELQGTETYFHLDSRPEYHRVYLEWKTNRALPYATSTGSQLSCRLLSMNRANGLAILPSRTSEVSCLPNGTEVDVVLIEYS